MQKFNLYAGVLALAIFSFAQYQGWDILAESAENTSRSLARGYHK